MKQHLIIFFLIVMCGVSASAQRVNLPGKSGSHSLSKDDKQGVDSLGYDQVKPAVKAWKLVDNFSRRDSVLVDTLIEELENHNPIFRNSISNAYLGNIGSPYQSNIFIDRDNRVEFLFLKPYSAYLKRPENNLYFDTKTPYTSLYYATGGPRGRAENILKVLHTQNITPNWNFGVNYDLISSDGQYMNQKTKVYDFSFSSRYKKGKYGFNVLLNQNRISVEENGGIIKDSLVTQTDEEAQNMQVNLTDSRNKLSNFNFFMNHSYELGVGKQVIEGDDTLTHYPARVVFTSHYESDEHKFVEGSVNSEFFKNSYFSNSESSDKTEYTSFSNTAQLVFNENENKWIRLGARFLLGNQMLKYNGLFKQEQVLLGQDDKKFHNNYVKASLYSLSGDKWNWKANARYTFEGYRQNDINLEYTLTHWIGKEKGNHSLSVLGRYQTQTPDVLFSQYNSNHLKWINSFDVTKEVELGLSYMLKPFKIKLLAQVNILEDYIYFNSDALPQQEGAGIQIATLSLQKNFVLGHFHLNQKVIGQNSSNEKVIPLPALSLYSNNYYTNTFFQGALDIKTGFAVHYNSRFYAPDYMPSTGQFLVQTQRQLGDYPTVDIYFDFRIKRTRFFLKYEHMNARIGSRNYFTTLHYPLNPSMFKYGLIWTFYN